MTKKMTWLPLFCFLGIALSTRRLKRAERPIGIKLRDTRVKALAVS